jgi:hypothetical protein
MRTWQSIPWLHRALRKFRLRKTVLECRLSRCWSGTGAGLRKSRRFGRNVELDQRTTSLMVEKAVVSRVCVVTF